MLLRSATIVQYAKDHIGMRLFICWLGDSNRISTAMKDSILIEEMLVRGAATKDQLLDEVAIRVALRWVARTYCIL